jgi:hypothetical protein
LLFTLVNIARFLDVESEAVLAQTIDRFTRRFHHIEAKLRQANKDFDNRPSKKWTATGTKRKLEAKGSWRNEQPQAVVFDAATYGDMPLTAYRDLGLHSASSHKRSANRPTVVAHRRRHQQSRH